MASRIERLLEEVQSLTHEEQSRLCNALDGAEAPSTEQRETSAEDEFKRRLVEAGLLKQIKPPITDLALYQDRKPFEVKGKPLSETIIEERR